MLFKALLTLQLLLILTLLLSTHSVATSNNNNHKARSKRRSRDPHIKRPANGTGTILISYDNVTRRHRNDERILVVFDLVCVDNINETDTRLITRINHIREKYSECLSLFNLSSAHYDTTNYSYVWMDLTCPLAIIQDKKNITIDYDELCIEYIMYEPIFWPNQTASSTSNINTTAPTHECVETQTTRARSYNLDLLDSPSLDNIYSFVDIATIRDNPNGLDLHIIDSGVQSQHVEFEEGQVIHAMGDGPATMETSLGTIYDVHGTHVAGSAGGINYGSSKGITIYDYRVCEYDEEGEVPCYTSMITDAMDMVVSKLKADPLRRGVINLSLGGEKTSAMNDIYQHYFDKMLNAGGIPVVAAGNDNVDACDISPAYSNKAVTVGAFTINRRKASFSNWGNCVDIWGPGDAIYSSYSSDSSDEYGYLSGTSMASPMIAGIVANMLAVQPALSFDGVLNALKNNSVRISSLQCEEYECMAPIYACGQRVYGEDKWEYRNKLGILEIVLIIAACALLGGVVTCIILFVVKQKKQIPHTTLTEKNDTDISGANEEEQQAIIPPNEGVTVYTYT
eukprot:166483_1